MTLLPAISHPGMTVKQFDRAVDRAHREGLRVTERVGAVAFVASGSKRNLVYRVTRETCSCPAGVRGLPCKHRGLAIFMADVMGGFGRPQPAPANVTFIHTRRHEPKPAA